MQVEDDTAFDFRRQPKRRRSDASQITTVEKEPEIIIQPWS